MHLMKVDNSLLMPLTKGTSPLILTQGKGLKILTSKQMFQRLPKALSQVKSGNAFENLLSEILETIYSLQNSKRRDIEDK